MTAKPGDLIAFSGANVVSDIINAGTFGIPRWGISHVAIVGEYEGLALFESTTLNDTPCLIRKVPFNGTQAHRIEERIASYKGRVWHYPLSRLLYDHEGKRLNDLLIAEVGIPYDEIGAFRACDHWSWWEQFLHPENLSGIFCSEWVASLYSEIGLFPTSDASRWSPNKLRRALRWRGIIDRPVRLK